MKKLYILGFVLYTLLLSTCFAGAQFFVCPQTYKSVNLGASMADVANACGQPTQVQQQTRTGTATVQSQEWVYTRGVVIAPGQTDTSNNPTLKITFQNDVVSQITTNNVINANVFPCYNRIQMGMSKSDVLFQCGRPNFVNNIQVGVPQSVDVIIWTYNFGAYKPLQIFEFTQGKLTSIENGPMVQP